METSPSPPLVDTSLSTFPAILVFLVLIFPFHHRPLHPTTNLPLQPTNPLLFQLAHAIVVQCGGRKIVFVLPDTRQPEVQLLPLLPLCPVLPLHQIPTWLPLNLLHP